MTQAARRGDSAAWSVSRGRRTRAGALPNARSHVRGHHLDPPDRRLYFRRDNVGEIFRWRETGQVRAGYEADLVVLDADPASDIRNLGRIRMVILGGEVIDRESLLVKSTGR